MKKTGQMDKLLTLLQDNPGGVTKEKVAGELGINTNCVPVYIHNLRKLHGDSQNIESMRNGKQVTGYKLGKLSNKSVVPAPVVDVTTATPEEVATEDEEDDGFDPDDIVYNEDEVADIRDSLRIRETV